MTPFQADVASTAERPSKLTKSGEHTKPFDSDVAGARTSRMATAAATAKSTLDDSVKCAYVKLHYKAHPAFLCRRSPLLISLTARSNLRARLNLQHSTVSCATTTVVQRVYDL